MNTALVPASLRATAALLAAGVLRGADTALDARAVGAVADAWEARAPALFEVRVDAATAQGRVQDFVQAANLSAALVDGTQRGDVAFYALSLAADGAPVQVLNSDTSFNLVYGANVSQEFLQHVVDALQPYPRGASPLSDPFPTLAKWQMQGC